MARSLANPPFPSTHSHQSTCQQDTHGAISGTPGCVTSPHSPALSEATARCLLPSLLPPWAIRGTRAHFISTADQGLQAFWAPWCLQDPAERHWHVRGSLLQLFPTIRPAPTQTQSSPRSGGPELFSGSRRRSQHWDSALERRSAGLLGELVPSVVGLTPARSSATAGFLPFQAPLSLKVPTFGPL